MVTATAATATPIGTTTGAAIDVIGATQAFRSGDNDLLVLDDVSISARPGEFVALVGPSGSGKSTLLRLLAGLDRPLFGDVYVGGRPVTGPDPDRALVFQDPTLLPWRTVRQNVALGPQARGILKQSAGRIDAALELVGLTEFADAWPSQLSGGMAQRTALARALVGDPSVLLLDEPLGKLDALTRRILQGELLSLWEQRRFTAVLVTHDVSEALTLADRIVVFSPRPARVREVVEVVLPRPLFKGAAAPLGRENLSGEARLSGPRDQSSPAFLGLRDHILALLDADLEAAASAPDQAVS
ncbi:ABC transporter ATP-binding protein [Microbacterium sp.]|uniref:ABC transporter ATP-binding protein n=1 Tax=Microbacterium sp. TaxID=51671 RepID=UPI003C71B599